LLELFCGARKDFQVLIDALAFDPSKQAQLETRANLACPLHDRHRALAACGLHRVSLLVRAQVQQQ
jgi:hypothetical protein